MLAEEIIKKGVEKPEDEKICPFLSLAHRQTVNCKLDKCEFWRYESCAVADLPEAITELSSVLRRMIRKKEEGE